MIKFKNINGDVFLAVGSIKRKSALNGEKSLTGTLFEGDDVLNKIDKGWSLEFDNEPYVVTYFERNDNDNTLEFDAIHKFFWDMNKDVLYFSWSGSHTAKAYLEQLFKDTGYQYALNFEPSAFEKENWGMKNKLSLFNDVIDSMGGEFEINGTLVSIFKNVGSDLSTIVRHGFNLSDMSLENDNTDFVTYGEGFGAYADQENQTGERLHVAYTSPLAKTFGKLHAEPIDDQRYTIKDNLLQAIKDKVDGSFAISIKLSLYDLTAAGYPYKMANVGDWLLAIDENLDFKQKIRIISVDDEFATDGTRISYTVTCGDIGVVQKYQQANASLGQKVDSAYQNAQDAKESSIQAVIAANGKNTNYWFDSKEEMDAFKANEGDMAFLRTGDGEAMYIYTKMPDGSFEWVKRVDPDTGEQISAGVDLAIETAQSQAAAMDEVRASEAAVFQSAANAALSSAAVERAVFSSNAASMANSASAHADTVANSASAYAKAQANSALNSANSELAKAKVDINNTINALTVGGRNYVLNSSGLNSSNDLRPTLSGAESTISQATISYGNDGIILRNPKENTAEWFYQIASAWTDFSKTPIISGNNYTLSVDVMGTVPQAVIRWGVNGSRVIENFKAFDINNTTWTRISLSFTSDKSDTSLYIRLQGGINNQFSTGFSGGEILEFRHVKIEDGNIPTAWTASPEDVVLDYTTKDNQIKTTITQYKDVNDGKVSKAQTDATTALGLVSTKVAQTDFDTVTGDLTTKYGQVKATADAVTTDVAKYKKTNDGRITADEANITANTKAIGLKVSHTDFDATTKDVNSKIASQQITVDGIKNTVTELQAKANAQGQINQLANTEFKPDYSGWTINEPRGSHQNKLNMAYKGSTIFEYDSRTGGGVANTGSVWLISDEIPINYGSPLSMSVVAKTIFMPTDETTGYFTTQPRFTLKDGSVTYGDTIVHFDSKDNNTDWLYGKSENIQIPANTVSVCFYSWIRGLGVVVRLAQPMLVFDNKIGDYVAGNYNNNARVAAVELDIDHITALVNDPNNGLSATATLAANGLSVATKAQSDATTAIQTAKGTQMTVTSVQKDVKDLQSTTTQTAGQVTTEIEDRKNGDKNTLTQTSQMISEQIADYNLGVMLNINAMANGITASVGNNNLIPNSEFEPMGSKWYLFNDRSVGAMIGNELVGSTAMSPTVQYKDWSIVNGSQGIAYSTKDWYISELIRTNDGNVFSMSVLAGRSDPDNGPTGVFDFRLAFFDKNKKLISFPKGTNPIQNVAKSDIQLYVNENITPPTGTYYVAFALGHNSAVTDAIYQPMLNYGSKVLKYTPTYGTDSESTILQLFKDHWAIGIQDNTFEMVSGIIGDNTSMNLISNNITLRGNTTVTEDFYAKGGNFKNLNASNITTGTINAANINVINLDVSSLSGNITNFVKSYWDGAYGEEVSIQSDHISFFTNSYRSNTTISEGQINMMVYNNYTKISENIGGIRHTILPSAENQDYLNFYLDGWSNVGDHGSNAAAHGGDGIVFSVSDGSNNGNNGAIGTLLLEWDNELLANSQGQEKGWHFWDFTKVHDDFLVTPDGAYQGLLVSSAKYNNTTYPAIMGNQKKDDGPGILMGSTEMYFMYKGDAYPLSLILKSAGWNL
ncbi:hypothetical protein G9406_06765 [Weissella paramesenteroides]|uniref:phage tail protein n=1 Tax=Weissella paramesenteroides TaxID=1249 RepID=UPI002402C94B|nr:phage tail protein [Weissella paramesenteroides]MDF8367278.1 hypothetical protein [Weissella paramesenteroides]